jgi:hypothetical protein
MQGVRAQIPAASARRPDPARTPEAAVQDISLAAGVTFPVVAPEEFG